MFDPQLLKDDFPLLARQMHGKPLVYLDNGATSHKPTVVLDAMSEYYQQHNANVHRGVHQLSDESTGVWHNSRSVIADFFAAETEELILVRNTTEAINGVVYGWGQHNIHAGDQIITTVMEHHANFVPWQQLAQRTGAELVVIGVDEVGRLKQDELLNRLNKRVKLVAVGFVSNVTGTTHPVEQIVAAAHQVGARVMVDAAQAAPHMQIKFDQLGADFMAISGHKMLGPMGTGVLLVKKALLESGEMQPWLFGGGMIDSVTVKNTRFNQDISERFTPGTPDVAGAVGLAAACQYLSRLGMDDVEQHDRQLVQYALQQLSQLPQLTLIGPTTPLITGTHLDRLGSVAFIYKGVHAHDVAQVLDSQGIAVRSGHHCTQPLHDACGWQATVRVSFQVYSTVQDIDAVMNALPKVGKMFTI